MSGGVCLGTPAKRFNFFVFLEMERMRDDRMVHERNVNFLGVPYFSRIVKICSTKLYGHLPHKRIFRIQLLISLILDTTSNFWLSQKLNKLPYLLSLKNVEIR